MLKITLDRNCLISLKNKDGEYEKVQRIIELHGQSKVAVYVCAISASEYNTSGDTSLQYKDFENFLIEIGCESLEEVQPMAYFEVVYLDHALLTDDSMIASEKQIHNILFPNIEFDYLVYCNNKSLDPDKKPLDKKWLNAKADVQSIWSHINAVNDIFVTQDSNFLKQKRQLLIDLGAKSIFTPSNALEFIRRNGA